MHPRLQSLIVDDMRGEGARVRSWVTWGTVTVLPMAAFLILDLGLVPDPSWVVPGFHFFIVSLTSFVALILAGLMVVAANQLQNARVVFLSLAFLGIAGFFSVHGLTTPGAIVQENNPWVGFSAHLSLLVGAVFLTLGSFGGYKSLSKWVVAHHGPLTLAFVTSMALYAGVALLDSWTTNVSIVRTAGADGLAGSQRIPPIFGNDGFAFLASEPVSRGATSLTMSLLIIVIIRYARQYRRTRSALLAGFLASSIFLLQAKLVMTFGTAWLASWWEYHVLMLAAFCAAVTALVREYASSRSVHGMVEGLLMRETIEQLDRSYGEVIAALVAAVEAKDPYTRGHTQRVSELAVRIAQELQMPQRRIYRVGQAAMLHDIGKIAVPDSILNKPGRLTAEEFAIVQEHPAKGCEILGNVRSLQSVLSGVRHHHERLDGTGYPDGLRGDEISWEARIIAVADVYDALTSTRSYRAAWSSERAISTLREEAGTKLDARCVAALERVLLAQAEQSVQATAADILSTLPVFAAQD